MIQKTTLVKSFILIVTLLFNFTFVNAQTAVFHFGFNVNLNDTSSNASILTAQGSFTPAYADDRDNNANSASDFPGLKGDFLSSNFNGIAGKSARSVTAWVKTNFTANDRLTILSWGTNVSEKCLM